MHGKSARETASQQPLEQVMLVTFPLAEETVCHSIFYKLKEQKNLSSTLINEIHWKHSRLLPLFSFQERI